MTASKAAAAWCPWCSGAIETEVAVCPTCGAALVESATVADGTRANVATATGSAHAAESAETRAEPSIPGLTQIDPAIAAFRARQLAPPPKKRSWLDVLRGGEPEPEPELPASIGPLNPNAIQRPSVEVRREMLRMELEALAASQAIDSAARRAEQQAAEQAAHGQPRTDAASPSADISASAELPPAVDSRDSGARDSSTPADAAPAQPARSRRKRSRTAE